MAARTLEFCSLEYLNQWIIHDSKYCDVLANGSEEEKLDTLRVATKYYGISRNLPRAADVDIGLPRYKPLLDVIDSVCSTDFGGSPVRTIREVEAEISRKYRGRGVLSLTTKILWLKVKSPVIIYDSQARVAIGTKDGDLESYYKAWRAGFGKHSEVIAEACDKLAAMSRYTIDEELATESYIQELTSHLWFRERVFDLYLWNAGRKA